MRQRREEEIKKKKIGRILIAFIALLLIFSNGTVKGKLESLIYRDVESLELLEEVKISLLENYKAHTLDDKLIIYDGREIATYDSKGSKEVIVKVVNNESIVDMRGTKIYIVDKEEGEIQSLEKDRTTNWTHNVDKGFDEILFKDYYLVLLNNNGENSVVEILNSDGKRLDGKAVESGQVLDVDVFKKNQGYLISKFSISDRKLVSNIAKYSVNGSLLWSQNYQDEIVQKLSVTDENSLIVITDKKIYHMTSNKELLWSRAIDGEIWDVKIDNEGNRIIVLTGGSKENLEIIGMNNNGRTIDKVNIDNIYDKIKLYDKNILLFGKKEILGLRDGKKIFKYSNNGEIKDVLWDKKNIFIIMDNRIRIMKSVSNK